MNIETTINIDHTILQRLENAASCHDLAKSSLIEFLLLDMMKTLHTKPVLFSRIKYQKKSENSKWHRLHVSFRCDVYEKALDLRKLCKSSVSRLIALAIEENLDIVLSILLKNQVTDNYLSQYIFLAHFSSKLESVIIYYDYPGEKELKYHLKN